MGAEEAVLTSGNSQTQRDFAHVPTGGGSGCDLGAAYRDGVSIPYATDPPPTARLDGFEWVRKQYHSPENQAQLEN